MVSPNPSAPPDSQPLSYADRAKKAQNIKPKGQVPSQRIIVTPAAPTSRSTSSAPSTSSVVSGTSYGVSKVSSTSTEETPVSSAISARAASRPSSPTLKDANGDVNHGVSHLPEPPTAPSKSTPAPPVNVWNVRKEQMAQARALLQSQSASVLPQKTSLDNALPPLPSSRSSNTPPEAGPGTASTSTALQNVRNHRLGSTIESSASVNGHTADADDDDDDAFVVRPRLPSAVDDAESWPEVGKSVAPVNSGTDGRDREEGGHERESSQSQTTSRKSEKTKWVPIPPQELQAAADALQQSRVPHPHMRNRPQQHFPPRTQGSYPASASGSNSTSAQGSAQTSGGQSRTHSSVGVRQSMSHTNSVPHSQTQSRTGSAHSSPRQPYTRRRLPEEGGAVGHDGVGPTQVVNRSMRSSRSGSPHPSGQSYIPPTEYMPSVGPYPPPSVVSPPNPHNNDTSNGIMYYPPLPPNVSATPSYNSSRGSPAQNPYALPPTMYPQQVPGMQMNPYAPTPYGMFPQFSYPYAPPYMYWHGGPQPVSPSVVPAAPPLDAGVPPPTMIARPPPPGESDAVAGYREVGFVLPPPAAYARVEEAQGDVERGRRGRELSFGSIGVAGASKSPSPAPESTATGAQSGASSTGGLGLDTGALEEEEKQGENGDKSFTTFSVGVTPGEPWPARIRSRTRTQSKGRLGERASLKTTAEQSEASAKAGEAPEGAETTRVNAMAETEVRVIDLTDPETKWEFGTTNHVEAEDSKTIEGATEKPAAGVSSLNALGMSPGPVAVPMPKEGYVPMGASAQMPAYVDAQPYVPPVTIPTGSMSTPPDGVASPSYGPQSALPPTSAASSGIGDEWEVKDYGYGFGRGLPPVTTREERVLRDRERDRDRRDYSEREYYGRPRRGSYSGGYGYDRGGHDRGFDRGGYSGRRGRGAYGGRSYHSRNFSRGGYQQAQARQPPPFVVQPAPQNDVNSYYPPAPQPVTAYVSPTYESYPYPPYTVAPVAAQQAVQQAPPLPMPLSALSFPLDPTRYCLLGQLEYYLSPQNMAQDFFLRQRMDSRGWISIPLIASFNRVRQLTIDLQLVKDVLTLSSLVEVNGDWVRMHQWEHFVLPNATKTIVEGEIPPDAQGPVVEDPPAVNDVAEMESSPDAEEEGEGEVEGDEEEEEDVVFVLGRDANRSWTPERRPIQKMSCTV